MFVFVFVLVLRVRVSVRGGASVRVRVRVRGGAWLCAFSLICLVGILYPNPSLQLSALPISACQNTRDRSARERI